MAQNIKIYWYAIYDKSIRGINFISYNFYDKIKVFFKISPSFNFYCFSFKISHNLIEMMVITCV